MKFHLPFVGGLEFSQLRADSDQPPQTAMEEQQIQVVALVVHRHPLLSRDEGEVRTEFQDGVWLAVQS